MKIDYRIGGLITSIAAGVLFASSVIAAEGGMANNSYVGDSSGQERSGQQRRLCTHQFLESRGHDRGVWRRTTST